MKEYVIKYRITTQLENRSGGGGDYSRGGSGGRSGVGPTNIQTIKIPDSTEVKVIQAQSAKKALEVLGKVIENNNYNLVDIRKI